MSGMYLISVGGVKRHFLRWKECNKLPLEASYMKAINASAWFDECYEEYADALFRFCFVKTSNRDIALDLSQEIFIRLWDQLVEGKAIENPRAFLYTVARNLVIDYYRKKKSDSLDALDEAGRQFEAGDSSSVTAEYREALAAINRLPEPYREVVHLRYVEDLPPREIALILGESVNTVSVRITRGMQELRSGMDI